MEPFDIDKIIKNKLQESNDLHRHEMESAKPFVWTAVQNQIHKRSITWYHLAAAVVMLMISFSFVLYSIQNGHKNEIAKLSGRIDQLQVKYISQEELLQAKETNAASLGNELKSLEIKLSELQQQKPILQKETLVYRTDTVYIKQIEYVNNTPDPMELKVVSANSSLSESDEMETTIAKEIETDQAIFSNYTYQDKRHASENIKFKFGSFTTRKN